MATISFSTEFDLSVSPKIFVEEDTADYIGQGIAEADVNGCFTITSPSATVIYNNTDFTDAGCDIKVSSSRLNQLPIQLPLAANSFPELGVYTILYTVYDKNLAAYSTVTNTYTYAYVSPEVKITQDTNCTAPLFTSADSTNYVVNGISPSFTGRQHVLQFPLGSGLSQITTAAPVITRGFEEFANGNQATQITTSLTYVFDDGLTIRDSITGSQAVTVDCTDACAIYCCLRAIEQQMIAYSTTNVALYQQTKDLFTQIMSIAGLATWARTCNKGSDISGYLNSIKLLANCTDDCSCSGDTPTLVTGLGGMVNNVVVDSCGEPITVTPVTDGGTTTYTVCFSATLLEKLNALYNSVVAAGTNIDSVTSSTTGYTTTYTVNAAAPVLYNTTSAVATSSGTMTVLQSYTLPINKLSTNGDVLELISEFDTDATTQAKAVDVRIGGTVCHSKVTEFRQTMSQKASRLIVRVTRMTSTTLFIQFLQVNSNGFYQTLGDGKLFYESGISVSDLSANTTLFQIRGRNIDAVPTENINCTQFTVTYFKK